MQNVIKLSTAVHEFVFLTEKKSLATMLKTILPSLPRAVIITTVHQVFRSQLTVTRRTLACRSTRLSRPRSANTISSFVTTQHTNRPAAIIAYVHYTHDAVRMIDEMSYKKNVGPVPTYCAAVRLTFDQFWHTGNC